MDLDWVNQVQVNRGAVEWRAATLTWRRLVKQEWEAAWLVRAGVVVVVAAVAVSVRAPASTAAEPAISR